ncbi:potassium channel family protein [Psychromonas sp. Urea-02u-13]|uniref:potassium channel family protein n=1 Tax=Psychromonas sp. Urea-02u-13 TaxID=2058326 RepID=UPI000C332D9E|nr:TrkA family potassium uptake protein [Psychromonas sp. Urea-02u-13]PKG39658.1 TrkA family potassium uptake protein [Psychromonas sp. Urea-02u-13]
MKLNDKQFAVIGLGRFGMALCEELSAQGAQVLAVDVIESHVKKAAEFASHAVVADCSNEETVLELKLDDYDIVMVAIGDDVNTSIFTTLVLKESGVKTVWVKAKDKYHAKILKKIGADKIISPERDMGIRIARNMLDLRIFDYLPLGSGLAIAEVVVGSKHFGSMINEHPCCQSEATTILAYKRGPTLHNHPDVTDKLEIGDILIVAGKEDKILEQFKKL